MEMSARREWDGWNARVRASRGDKGGQIVQAAGGFVLPPEQGERENNYSAMPRRYGGRYVARACALGLCSGFGAGVESRVGLIHSCRCEWRGNYLGVS